MTALPRSNLTKSACRPRLTGCTCPACIDNRNRNARHRLMASMCLAATVVAFVIIVTVLRYG